MSTDLTVGDRIADKFGPYRATGTVIAIKEHGAVIAWDPIAVFVGYDDVTAAPNGTPLTTDRAHGWVGRALWGGVERAEAL